jgi:hypothetical protein
MENRNGLSFEDSENTEMSAFHTSTPIKHIRHCEECVDNADCTDCYVQHMVGNMEMTN